MRIWNDWCDQIEHQPDGLCGVAPFEEETREAQVFLAGERYCGAGPLQWPCPPQEPGSAESAQRMQEGWNARIQKARKDIQQYQRGSNRSVSNEMELATTANL